MTTSRDDERQSAMGSGVDARDVHIREWTGPELSARVNDAMAIYVLAMRRVGLDDPSRGVFLDDAARNVAGARAVGLHAILVDFDPQPAVDELRALAFG